MSAHRVEHDHGDLDARSSPGNRRRAARTPAPFPTVGALLAFGGPGPRLKLHGADLHFDLPVGEEVAVSAGVARRAAFRGDDDIAVAGFPVVGQIAVRVLHHPTRKVWREFGIGHPSNSLDTPVARWRVDQVFHEQLPDGRRRDLAVSALDEVSFGTDGNGAGCRRLCTGGCRPVT